MLRIARSPCVSFVMNWNSVEVWIAAAVPLPRDDRCAESSTLHKLRSWCKVEDWMYSFYSHSVLLISLCNLSRKLHCIFSSSSQLSSTLSWQSWTWRSSMPVQDSLRGWEPLKISLLWERGESNSRHVSDMKHQTSNFQLAVTQNYKQSVVCPFVISCTIWH